MSEKCKYWVENIGQNCGSPWRHVSPSWPPFGPPLAPPVSAASFSRAPNRRTWTRPPGRWVSSSPGGGSKGRAAGASGPSGICTTFWSVAYLCEVCRGFLGRRRGSGFWRGIHRGVWWVWRGCEGKEVWRESWRTFGAAVSESSAVSSLGLKWSARK